MKNVHNLGFYENLDLRSHFLNPSDFNCKTFGVQFCMISLDHLCSDISIYFCKMLITIFPLELLVVQSPFELMT